MKPWRWGIAVLVLLAVAGAFYMANFRLARTATHTNTSFSRANSYNPELPEVVDSNRVFLHIEERVGLAERLGWELRRALEAEGFSVILLNNEPGSNDVPLLLARVRDPHSIWTPVYAKGQLSVDAAYTSYPVDLSLSEHGGIEFRGDATEARIPIRCSFQADVVSSSVGLISFQAHRETLVREAAEGIAEYLRSLIEDVKAAVAEKEKETGS